MKLTNVARASLNDELAKDYKSYLIQNGLRLWHKDSRECLAMRERLKHDVFPNLPAAKSKDQVMLTGLDGLADFVKKTKSKHATNALLCAIHQASYLHKRQIESQAKDFKEHGGFTERLHAARVQARAEQTGTPLWKTHAPPHRRQNRPPILGLPRLTQLQRHPRHRTLSSSPPHPSLAQLITQIRNERHYS